MCSAKNNRITCKQAREIDLVDFLSNIGIEPASVKGHQFWYHSPFRDEQTPSFKVNGAINRWYDFGDGTNGSLIDLGIRLKNCSVREFLQMLESGTFTHCPHRPGETNVDGPAIAVLSNTALSSPELVSYLSSRKITLQVANRYCKEIHYSCNGRNYCAVGFANRSGGFELRSKNFKGTVSPKDYTLLCQGRAELAVFEGFIDFMSYLLIMGKDPQQDYLILNSLAFFQRAMECMMGYSRVQLWTNNDDRSNEVVSMALGHSDIFVDQRNFFFGYNDLNDMLNNKPIVQRIKKS
ncbi:CHC2 zinc finger domain-containing protein [Pedobacter chitinilyticus]|uniref:DNA primase n=1 Tax=Pedobacter chitinilyticus TaxID=2233776 RepID=A0A3S3PP08_9SPHI|nr:CHC2 zinc finger domain-containing protein [Pedobacter chitinilyticus]RWU08185.1 DNA primase [Pedobacter chitinilyticus]